MQRKNNHVLRMIQRRQATELTLDVGYGTGDLVLNLARN